MNKRLIALVIGIIVLISLGNILFAQNGEETTTKTVEEPVDYWVEREIDPYVYGFDYSSLTSLEEWREIDFRLFEDQWDDFEVGDLGEEFDFASLETMQAEEIFLHELGIDLGISEGIRTATFDPETGLLTGDFGSFDPVNFPSDMYKLEIVIVSGKEDIEITPKKEDGTDDIDKKYTISNAESFTLENGQLVLTAKEGEDVTITGAKDGKIVLNDGTTLRFKNLGGSLTVDKDGDVQAENAIVAVFDESISPEDLVASKEIQEYLEDYYDPESGKTLRGAFEEALGLSLFGPDNKGVRELIYENHFEGEDYKGSEAQNKKLIDALSAGTIELPTEITFGKFEIEGDAVLLDPIKSTKGEQSTYIDLVKDLKAKSTGYSLAVLPDGEPTPEDWTFDGYVSYSYDEETGEKSFKTAGPAYLEYDGIKVMSTEMTATSSHDSQGDSAFGIITLEYDSMIYEGLTSTSLFSKTLGEVSVDGGEQGKIAVITVKLGEGDLSRDEFIVIDPETGKELIKGVPLDIIKEGDDVIVDISAEELAAVIGYFTDPTQFRFALLKEDIKIILGDKAKGAFFAINKDLGMVYQPSYGIPVSILPSFVMLEYLGEEDTPLMVVQALIDSKSQYSEAGYRVGDKVTILEREITEGLIPKYIEISGTIISIITREGKQIILLDTDGDGSPDREVTDNDVALAELSNEESWNVRKQRLEMLKNKPQEVAEQLDEYAETYGGVRALEAKIKKGELGEDYKLDYYEEDWFEQLMEEYEGEGTEYEEALQESAMEIAEDADNINDFKKYYRYAVDVDIDSELGSEALGELNRLTSLETIQQAKIQIQDYYLRELAKQRKYKSIFEKGFFTEFFGDLGTSIEESFETTYDPLAGPPPTFMDAVIEGGFKLMDSGSIVRQLNVFSGARDRNIQVLMYDMGTALHAWDKVEELIMSGAVNDLDEAFTMLEQIATLSGEKKIDGDWRYSRPDFALIEQLGIPLEGPPPPQQEESLKFELPAEFQFDISRATAGFGVTASDLAYLLHDDGHFSAIRGVITSDKAGTDEEYLALLDSAREIKGEKGPLVARALAMQVVDSASDPEIVQEAQDFIDSLRTSITVTSLLEGEGMAQIGVGISFALVGGTFGVTKLLGMTDDLARGMGRFSRVAGQFDNLDDFGRYLDDMDDFADTTKRTLYQFDDLDDFGRTAGNIDDAHDAQHLAYAACFAAGTKITLFNLAFKNIEDIKAGDLVLSYNIRNKRFVSGRVLDAFERETNELIIINKEIKTTAEHPFFVLNKNKYIDAEDLSVGDILLGSDGSNIVITSLKIERLKEKIKVYNFDVDGYDNYFADNVLVHNNPCAQTTGAYSYATGDKLLNGPNWRVSVQYDDLGKPLLQRPHNMRVVIGKGNKPVRLYRGSGPRVVPRGLEGMSVEDARRAFGRLTPRQRFDGLVKHVDATVNFPDSRFISATGNRAEAMEYALKMGNRRGIMVLDVPQNQFLTIQTGTGSQRVVEMAIPGGIKKEWVTGIVPTR